MIKKETRMVMINKDVFYQDEGELFKHELKQRIKRKIIIKKKRD